MCRYFRILDFLEIGISDSRGFRVCVTMSLFRGDFECKGLGVLQGKMSSLAKGFGLGYILVQRNISM